MIRQLEVLLRRNQFCELQSVQCALALLFDHDVGSLVVIGWLGDAVEISVGSLLGSVQKQLMCLLTPSCEHPVCLARCGCASLAFVLAPGADLH